MNARDVLNSGSGAFAQMTLEGLPIQSDPYSTTAIVMGDLVYRQVADPSHPVFFLRNPSMVYGFSNLAYAAESAYREIVGLVASEDVELPVKLIDM